MIKERKHVLLSKVLTNLNIGQLHDIIHYTVQETLQFHNDEKTNERICVIRDLDILNSFIKYLSDKNIRGKDLVEKSIIELLHAKEYALVAAYCSLTAENLFSDYVDIYTSSTEDYTKEQLIDYIKKLQKNRVNQVHKLTLTIEDREIGS